MDDWDAVTTIGQRGTRSNVVKDNSSLNAARRAGAVVETSKKTGGPGDHQRIAALDRNDAPVPPKTINADLGKTIARIRTEKGLTQKDLAQKVNDVPKTIQSYENGSAIPNQALLAKMEKILGVKLRGQSVGEPLVAKKK